VNLYSALQGVNTIFLDTAPIIYFIENHPQFADIVEVFIEQLDQGNLQGIISPVTVAECLVNPFKEQDQKLQQDFVDFMLRQQSILMKETDVNNRNTLQFPEIHFPSTPEGILSKSVDYPVWVRPTLQP